MAVQDQLQGLLKQIEEKAETLKRDNPQEYERLLSEFAQALEEFNEELKASLL